MKYFNRIYSNPHLAIKSAKNISNRTKKPVCVDRLRYGVNSFEFRILPHKITPHVIAECVKSRRSWKTRVLDFDFLEQWDKDNEHLSL